MSAYAQPTYNASASGSFSPLHFPLSSPPLHIPPSLQELDTPTSNGFRFGLVRRDRTRQSSYKGMERRDSSASVETLPEGTLSSPSYSFEEYKQSTHAGTQRTASSSFHGAYAGGEARRPLTTANLLLRRSSSLVSVTSPEHDDNHHQHHRLPELSRTNSVSTCSSSGEGGMLRTPPHNLYEDFEVLSEEDEQEDESFNDGSNGESLFPPLALSLATVTKSQYNFGASSSEKKEEEEKKIVIHTSPPPALLKRPGLPRRDTPTPLKGVSLSNVVTKPSKSFRSSLTPVPVSVATPTLDAPLLSVPTTAQTTGKPQRPVLKRRDTPRPVSRPVTQFTTFTPTFTPAVEEQQADIKEITKVPNFFSTSLRRSLRASSSIASDEEAVAPREEEVESPISFLSSSSSEESFTSYAYSPPSLPLSKYVVGLSQIAKGKRLVGKKEKSFSSVLDGKVWVSV